MRKLAVKVLQNMLARLDPQAARPVPAAPPEGLLAPALERQTAEVSAQMPISSAAADPPVAMPKAFLQDPIQALSVEASPVPAAAGGPEFAATPVPAAAEELPQRAPSEPAPAEEPGVAAPSEPATTMEPRLETPPEHVTAMEPQVETPPEPAAAEKPEVAAAPVPAAAEEPEVAAPSEPATAMEPRLETPPEHVTVVEPQVATPQEPAAAEKPEVAAAPVPAAAENPTYPTSITIRAGRLGLSHPNTVGMFSTAYAPPITVQTPRVPRGGLVYNLPTVTFQQPPVLSDLARGASTAWAAKQQQLSVAQSSGAVVFHPWKVALDKVAFP